MGSAARGSRPGGRTRTMRYADFRDRIRGRLERAPAGLTWAELRDDLRLPYARACPTWTRRLEQEIGLTRAKGRGRALVWKVTKR